MNAWPDADDMPAFNHYDHYELGPWRRYERLYPTISDSYYRSTRKPSFAPSHITAMDLTDKPHAFMEGPIIYFPSSGYYAKCQDTLAANRQYYADVEEFLKNGTKSGLIAMSSDSILVPALREPDQEELKLDGYFVIRLINILIGFQALDADYAVVNEFFFFARLLLCIIGVLHMLFFATSMMKHGLFISFVVLWAIFHAIWAKGFAAARKRFEHMFPSCFSCNGGIDDLEQALNASKELIDQLKINCQSADDSYRNSITREQSTREALRESEKINREVRNDFWRQEEKITTLGGEVTAKTLECEQLREDIDGLKYFKKDVQEGRYDCCKVVENKTQMIKDLKAEVKRANSQAQVDKTQIAGLERSVRRSEEKYSRSQRSHDELYLHYQRAIQNHDVIEDTRKAEIQQLTRKVGTLQQSVTSRDKEIREMNASLQKQQQDRSEVMELEREVSKTSSVEKHVQITNDEEHARQIAALKSEIERQKRVAKKSCAPLKKQIQSLRKQMRARGLEVTQMKMDVEQQKREFEQQKQEVEQQKREVKTSSFSVKKQIQLLRKKKRAIGFRVTSTALPVHSIAAPADVPEPVIEPVVAINAISVQPTDLPGTKVDDSQAVTVIKTISIQTSDPLETNVEDRQNVTAINAISNQPSEPPDAKVDNSQDVTTSNVISNRPTELPESKVDGSQAVTAINVISNQNSEPPETKVDNWQAVTAVDAISSHVSDLPEIEVDNSQAVTAINAISNQASNLPETKVDETQAVKPAANSQTVAIVETDEFGGLSTALIKYLDSVNPSDGLPKTESNINDPADDLGGLSNNESTDLVNGAKNIAGNFENGELNGSSTVPLFMIEMTEEYFDALLNDPRNIPGTAEYVNQLNDPQVIADMAGITSEDCNAVLDDSCNIQGTTEHTDVANDALDMTDFDMDEIKSLIDDPSFTPDTLFVDFLNSPGGSTKNESSNVYDDSTTTLNDVIPQGEAGNESPTLSRKIRNIIVSDMTSLDHPANDESNKLSDDLRSIQGGPTSLEKSENEQCTIDSDYVPGQFQPDYISPTVNTPVPSDVNTPDDVATDKSDGSNSIPSEIQPEPMVSPITSAPVPSDVDTPENATTDEFDDLFDDTNYIPGEFQPDYISPTVKTLISSDVNTPDDVTTGKCEDSSDGSNLIPAESQPDQIISPIIGAPTAGDVNTKDNVTIDRCDDLSHSSNLTPAESQPDQILSPIIGAPDLGDVDAPDDFITDEFDDLFDDSDYIPGQFQPDYISPPVNTPTTQESRSDVSEQTLSSSPSPTPKIEDAPKNQTNLAAIKFFQNEESKDWKTLEMCMS